MNTLIILSTPISVASSQTTPNHDPIPMSLDLPAGVVPCPIASGLHFTENPNDPDGFYYIMYRHNDGFTWFAGTTRKRPRLLPDGHYAHYIKSTVQGDRIPGKHDLVVAACNYDHLVTYHALEMHVSVFSFFCFSPLSARAHSLASLWTCITVYLN